MFSLDALNRQMGAILEMLLSLFPTLRPCPDISRKNLMNPNKRFPSSIWELGIHRRLTCSLGSCNRSWESWVSASKFSLCVLHSLALFVSISQTQTAFGFMISKLEIGCTKLILQGSSIVSWAVHPVKISLLQSAKTFHGYVNWGGNFLTVFPVH